MSGQPPSIRASDAERELTLAQLRDAATEGRLTLDDFSQRTDFALRAISREQLSEVVADLPAAPALAPGRQLLPGSPSVVGILGSAKRKGRWRVGHELHAVAILGECKIDLREAIIDAEVISVDALCIMGNIEIIVPEGVEVELQGVAILGTKELKVGDARPFTSGPLVQVTGLCVMGEIKIRDKPTLLERAWKRLES